MAITPYVTTTLLTSKDANHPITKGLKTPLPVMNDELYANLKWQPESTYHVLATAYDDHSIYDERASDARNKQPISGAGVHEPMLWTTQYGQGRVFVDALGHDFGAVTEQVFKSDVHAWRRVGRDRQRDVGGSAGTGCKIDVHWLGWREPGVLGGKGENRDNDYFLRWTTIRELDGLFYPSPFGGLYPADRQLSKAIAKRYERLQRQLSDLLDRSASFSPFEKGGRSD